MNNDQSLSTGTTKGFWGDQTSVSAANLRAFLLSNAPKKPNEKARIRFIDCQDVKGKAPSVIPPEHRRCSLSVIQRIRAANS